MCGEDYPKHWDSTGAGDQFREMERQLILEEGAIDDVTQRELDLFNAASSEVLSSPDPLDF